MLRLCVSVKVTGGTEVTAVGEPVQVRLLPFPEESADGLPVSSSVQYPTRVGSAPVTLLVTLTLPPTVRVADPAENDPAEMVRSPVKVMAGDPLVEIVPVYPALTEI